LTDTHPQPPEAHTGRLRGEARNEQLRAALKPLGSHERPTALKIAVAVALALAVTIAVGTATVHQLRSRGGSIPGGMFLCALLLALGWGMYQRRYWAVVAFEGLLAFQMIVASLALVLASTVYAAVGCTLALVLGGCLFWFLVRVMGRIQATEMAHSGSLQAATAAAALPGPRVGDSGRDSCDRVE
jgi:hypothetical protein